ncbi:MAG TPA: hypothetical protein VLJ41_15060 [Segetibacter sp.]|nr:hypothetical protein [Segetibacter sp.]
MNNQSLETTGNSKQIDRPKTYVSKRNTMLIAALVILALFAGLWIWKSVQISNIKKDSAERQQALKQRADEVLMEAEMKYMKLIAKPYVWAIRTEMMRGNIDAVNLYANDMVKEKNFQSIMVADDKGTIISSTDKKLEGKDFSSVGKSAYLTADSTIIDQVNKSTLMVSSPVMGFNKRIGTLVFNYTIQKAEL